MSLDTDMAQVLFRLEMLSHGSTQAWNASGGGSGEPDDKVVSTVAREEKPLHIYYRERYDRAHKPESKEAVYKAAKDDLDAWGKRPDFAKITAAAAGDVKLEDLILNDDEGKSPDIIARQRNIHPDLARRIRRKAGVSTEDGKDLTEVVEHKPTAARELRQQGVSTRDIATRLDVSQSAVMKWIRQNAE